jgi:RNA polymerase sigma-70 factor (ECF subfamily)
MLTAALENMSAEKTPESVSATFITSILQNQGILRKICRIYQKDRDEQEDLYQEMVLNAWRSYPNFQGRSKFSTWLYRVALNTALYQCRRDRPRRNQVDIAVADQVPTSPDNQEQLDLLYRAMDQLDPQDKSLVVFYLDELSYTEIAEITGWTVTNVGVKLNRIKKKMKLILESYGA